MALHHRDIGAGTLRELRHGRLGVPGAEGRHPAEPVAHERRPRQFQTHPRAQAEDARAIERREDRRPVPGLPQPQREVHGAGLHAARVLGRKAVSPREGHADLPPAVPGRERIADFRHLAMSHRRKVRFLVGFRP
jgi:hypothetical protein